MEIKEKAAELIGCNPISCKSSNVNYCQKHYDKGYMCGEMKRLVEMAKWVEEKKDAQIAEALNQLSDLKGLYFRAREELKRKPIIVLSIGGKWEKCYNAQVNLFDNPEKAEQYANEVTCRSHGYFQLAKVIKNDTTYEMHGLDEDGEDNEVTASITNNEVTMGAYIARQPNGKLCRFSTNVDGITDYNMTEAEYIEMCAERAREEARETLKRYVYGFDNVIEAIETAVEDGTSNDDIETINKMLSEMGSDKIILRKEKSNSK